MDEYDLLDACHYGCLQEVIEMLTEDNVNIRNDDGLTLLMMASGNGHINISQRLFQFGADPKLVAKDGSSALHFAVKSGYNPVTLKELVDEGVPLNLQDVRGQTALHIAVERKVPPLVEDLLQMGADTTLRDANGKTPLYYACKEKCTIIVRLILEYTDKTRLTQLGKAADANGLTPAHVATANGMYDILFLLFEHGCVDILALDNQNRSILHVACEEKFEPCASLIMERALPSMGIGKLKDKNGDTALHIAARLGEDSLLLEILEQGSDVQERNDRGLTAFGCALLQQQDNACKTLISVMLSSKLHVSPGKSLQRELHLAALLGRNEVIKNIIVLGMDVDARDEYDNTMLHIAASTGKLDTVVILLEAGVDPGIVNSRGLTACGVAISLDQHDTAAFLQSLEQQMEDPRSSTTFPTTHPREVNTKLLPQDRNTRDDMGQSFAEAGDDSEEMAELGETMTVVQLASWAMDNCSGMLLADDADRRTKNGFLVKRKSESDVDGSRSRKDNVLSYDTLSKEKVHARGDAIENPIGLLDSCDKLSQENTLRQSGVEELTNSVYKQSCLETLSTPPVTEKSAPEQRKIKSTTMVANCSTRSLKVGPKVSTNIRISKSTNVPSDVVKIFRKFISEKCKALDQTDQSSSTNNSFINCSADKVHIGNRNILNIKIGKAFIMANNSGLWRRIQNPETRRKGRCF